MLTGQQQMLSPCYPRFCLRTLSSEAEGWSLLRSGLCLPKQGHLTWHLPDKVLAWPCSYLSGHAVLEALHSTLTVFIWDPRIRQCFPLTSVGVPLLLPSQNKYHTPDRELPQQPFRTFFIHPRIPVTSAVITCPS